MIWVLFRFHNYCYSCLVLVISIIASWRKSFLNHVYSMKQFSILTLHLAGCKYPLPIVGSKYIYTMYLLKCLLVSDCILHDNCHRQKFLFFEKKFICCFSWKISFIDMNEVPGVKILLKSGNFIKTIKIRKWHRNDVKTLNSFFDIKQIWGEQLKTGQCLKLVSSHLLLVHYGKLEFFQISLS